MKYIEVDEELYRYIAGKTEHIGESASDILRRLLGLSAKDVVTQQSPQTISHPSMETNKSIRQETPLCFDALINQGILEQQKGAVGRFLFVLESLYQATGHKFDQVLQIQGRDRLYFATSKDALLEASQTANPKEIGNSGFWVTTNNNTAKKRTILMEVLVQFGASMAQATKLASLALPVPVVE